MKITTIIPFFNSGSALARMLDSILAGTVLPAELLLIDDGSSDNSPEIALEYSQKYSFIKYIPKEHAGVSAARNLGVQMASGDFISFLDADDYIEKTMYEQMLNSISEEDFGCICGYFTEKDGISTEYKISSEYLTSEDLLKSMFMNDNVKGFLFTRLFKASIIKEMRFNTDISMCEDLLFQSTLLTKYPKLRFACVNAPLYHYIQNSSSATGGLNFFTDNVFKYKPAFDKIKALVPHDYVDNSYNAILEYSMYCLLVAYKNGDKSVKNQIRLLQKELKNSKSASHTKRRFFYMYAPFLFSHFIK